VSGPVRALELNRDDQALVVVERGTPPRTRSGDPLSNSQALQQIKPSRD
jgi:hypothetical protein